MNKLSVWLKDSAYMLAMGTVMYLIHKPPKHYLGHIKNGKVPIIIFPGIFGRWAFMKEIADHLSILGHPVYIVPTLGNNLADIPTSAKKVKEVIEKNNLKNLIIVAHSKGGLIGKYFMLHEDQENRTKGMIAIATPFSGSLMAKLLPLSPITELTPESKIVKYLNEHNEVNNKIVSIIPSYDNIVWHNKGSFLEGARKNINVAIGGHHQILKDKKVWEKVVENIEEFSKN